MIDRISRSLMWMMAIMLFLPGCGADNEQTAERTGSNLLQVGVFSNRGASATCVVETIEALRIDTGIEPSAITAARIASGGLSDLDVLVFPGGSGSTQYNSMGLALGDTVSDYVINRGKGVVGICAGAYLLSDSKDYPCLRLISAGAVDIEHDKRGSAVVEVRFAAEGLELFPEMAGSNPGYIQYHDGPLLVPAEGADDTPLHRYATFISDVHCSADVPAGMTPGKIFLAGQEVGRGRVFACAGHPESTTGMRWLVPRMARWAAGEKMVEYGSNVVRPEVGEREIMHDDALEKELFWNLFADSPSVRISAMQTLVQLRHRNGFRWAVGMLRDPDPGVRAEAAGVLAEAEYTVALEDLEVALRKETDRACRSVMKDCLKRLRAMRAE
ncbi:MAG: hypothetical protein GF417_01220 [Candidatus Latescibacteria bacterium]|nr:hypothetical protein [bacterium]MBD3423048.1 hypothetical protein [Candidatus Latescibacterota bacterium]